jgi:hypothetical protein
MKPPLKMVNLRSRSKSQRAGNPLKFKKAILEANLEKQDPANTAFEMSKARKGKI